MTKELLLKRLEVAKIKKNFFKTINKNIENIYKEINKKYWLDLKKAKNNYFAEKLKMLEKIQSWYGKSLKEHSIEIQNQKDTVASYRVLHIFSPPTFLVLPTVIWIFPHFLD